MTRQKPDTPASVDRIIEIRSPHIAGCVNGRDIRLAKNDGAFERHHDDGIAEAFLVVKGGFAMKFRANGEAWDVPIAEGDLIVASGGVARKSPSSRSILHSVRKRRTSLRGSTMTVIDRMARAAV